MCKHCAKTTHRSNKTQSTQKLIDVHCKSISRIDSSIGDAIATIKNQENELLKLETELSNAIKDLLKLLYPKFTMAMCPRIMDYWINPKKFKYDISTKEAYNEFMQLFIPEEVKNTKSFTMRFFQNYLNIYNGYAGALNVWINYPNKDKEYKLQFCPCDSAGFSNLGKVTIFEKSNNQVLRTEVYSSYNWEDIQKFWADVKKGSTKKEADESIEALQDVASAVYHQKDRVKNNKKDTTTEALYKVATFIKSKEEKRNA